MRADAAGNAGVGHHGGGAEGAFHRMDGRVKLDFRAAVRAVAQVPFLGRGVGKRIFDAAAEGGFGDRTGFGSGSGQRFGVAAMVTDQLPLTGCKAHVGAALGAGEAVIVGRNFRIGHRGGPGVSLSPAVRAAAAA
jgi:hypothetical protein